MTNSDIEHNQISWKFQENYRYSWMEAEDEISRFTKYWDKELSIFSFKQKE